MNESTESKREDQRIALLNIRYNWEHQNLTADDLTIFPELAECYQRYSVASRQMDLLLDSLDLQVSMGQYK